MLVYSGRKAEGAGCASSEDMASLIGFSRGFMRGGSSCLSAVETVRKALEVAGGTRGNEACSRGMGRITLPVAAAVVAVKTALAALVGVIGSDNLSVMLSRSIE